VLFVEALAPAFFGARVSMQTINPKSFAITIFLADGQPDGLRTVEKAGWIGHAATGRCPATGPTTGESTGCPARRMMR